MAETIHVGTIYLGKQVCIDIAKVSNNTGDSVTDVYVDLTLPEGVVFTQANLAQGSYDPQINRWNVGTLLPLQTINGEFCFEITDECLSSFRFDFAINSLSACNQDCLSLARECVILKGQSCCEIDNCGFTKLTSDQFEEPCPDPDPTSPTNPPANPIQDQYHIEFYSDCEVWWKYDGTDWVITNGVVASTGSVSELSNLLVGGNRIATHYDGILKIEDIYETITEFYDQISGHRIASYNKENGDTQDLYETVTTISSDEAGVITYTDEAGIPRQVGRQMAAGSVNVTFTSSNEFSVTFPFTFDAAPVVTISPAAPSSGLYQVRIESVTTTGFTAKAVFISSGGAPANYSSYNWMAMGISEIGQTPTPTPSPMVSMTPTPTNTVTPTITLSSTVTSTPVPSSTATPTPTPSITPSVTTSSTPTPTPSNTVGVTPTVTPTASVTPSRSATPTPTPSITPTRNPTPTPTPSSTPTTTPVTSPTPTPSPTFGVTPTSTPSPTTSSVTPTPTPTNTNTPGLTPTPTPTNTIGVTPTVTPSITVTGSTTPTPTSTPADVSPTPTPSSTPAAASPTPTPTNTPTSGGVTPTPTPTTTPSA